MFLKTLFQKISVKAKLAWLLLFVFGTATILFNAILFLFTIETLQKDFDDALFNYAVDVAESIEFDRQGDLASNLLKVDHGKILPFPLGTALIQVRDREGKVLARVGDFGDFQPPVRRDFARIRAGEEAVYRSLDAGTEIPSPEAHAYRVISFPLDHLRNPQYLLQVAVPMHLMESQIANRLYYLQIGIPMVLIFAGLLGFFVSGRALAPVGEMIRAARAVNVHDMSQRVPVPLANDEIKQLGLTLNEMLSRIEKAFQSQERFVADASHQLLSPLTILKGEIEGALKKDATPDEKEKILNSSLQEVNHLARIVKDMLLLSRVDAGKGALNMQSVNLDEVLIEALERIDSLAVSKNIKLKFNIEPSQAERKSVRGDYDLLLHLAVILLENAVKYSPDKGHVEVLLIWSDQTSRIQIKDQGPGIPASEQDLIFERFRRGQATDNQTEGYGLGLAIARKIAQLHSSELNYRPAPPTGTEFYFEIKNEIKKI